MTHILWLSEKSGPQSEAARRSDGVGFLEQRFWKDHMLIRQKCNLHMRSVQLFLKKRTCLLFKFNWEIIIDDYFLQLTNDEGGR